MSTQSFPRLDVTKIGATRNAVHNYTQVLGDWSSSNQPRRKHWWQLAVHPSIGGISTGLVHSGIDFELELELGKDRLRGRVVDGNELSEPLAGRPANELAEIVKSFLLDNGIDGQFVPTEKERDSHAQAMPAYSAQIAETLGTTLRSVHGALATFRAGIREETSPIQIWPHHFDLAMLWLPGEKIPGQDPDNEEYSDKQMNFGFTFGDEGIPEPYFYVTAYPLPDEFSVLLLPPGTVWNTQGFSGAVLPYRSLLENSNPAEYLVDLWNGLVSAYR
jgi:hypothetical protein